MFFMFKQKTAYEITEGDWSSDVCSSDLEPARSFDADVLEMTATARHTRHGAVTIAARRAISMAGPCEPGDVLGVIEGDFAVVGHELTAVATEILERMLGAGGELVTLVTGAE